MKPTNEMVGRYDVTLPSSISTLENSNERESLSRLERVAVCYPSGNTTAVLFEQISDYDPKILNQQIMQTWKDRFPGEPEIEQCCVLSEPQNAEAIARVEMLGGEFCGNATRSALWVLAEGQRCTGLIEVSGVNRPLLFSVRDKKVTLEMPMPQSGELVRRVDEGLLVRLDGITQLVVSPRSKQTPRQLLETILSSNRYELVEQPAVGVSMYDESSSRAEFCVWVKAVDTMFDETACGSGTCAIGIGLASKLRQDQRLNVTQPSGETITTEAAFDNELGEVVASNIAGQVSILYDGVLELS